jgi:hypothetical protein
VMETRQCEGECPNMFWVTFHTTFLTTSLGKVEFRSWLTIA